MPNSITPNRIIMSTGSSKANSTAEAPDSDRRVFCTLLIILLSDTLTDHRWTRHGSSNIFWFLERRSIALQREFRGSRLFQSLNGIQIAPRIRIKRLLIVRLGIGQPKIRA